MSRLRRQCGRDALAPRVDNDGMTTSTGGTGEPTRRIGAYGVLTDDAGRMLLTRSSDRSDVPGTWYLPGGGVEQGEDPATAAVRETAEETGLEVEVAALRTVTADVLDLPARGQRLHTDRLLYDLRLLGGQLRAEPAGTTDLARWVTPEELAGLALMPFVAAALGLPTAPARARTDLPAGESPPAARTGRKEREQRFAAYAYVTDPSDRVLLTRNSPGYPGAGCWHLPGGGTDHGELPAEAVLRELTEESGQAGEVVELLGATHRHQPALVGPEGYPLDWHTVCVLYRVAVSEPGIPCVMDVGGSTDAVAWFSPQQLADLPVTEVVNWALRTAAERH